MSWLPYVGVAAVVGASSLVQSVSGFGFALVSVPLLTALLGVGDAVAMSAIMSVVSGSVLAVRWGAEADRGRLRWLIPAAFAGMPLGALILARAPEAPLRIAVALSVLIATALLASGWTLRSEHRPAETVAGFLSGVLNTSIGTGGPPVVLVLQASGLDPRRFRATTLTFFTCANLVALPLLWWVGRFSPRLGPAAIVALPALWVGGVVGGRLSRRLDPDHFRGVVLGLLVVSAATALASVAL